MASYLVTGASRGIGFEFVRQLSADAKNTVVALVRNKESTEKKIAAEIGASNITVVQADLTDYKTVNSTVDTVSQATGGKLDYIIGNAGLISEWSGNDDVEDLAVKDPQLLDNDMIELFRVNVIGNMNLFSCFVPLLRKGAAKKAIVISSGMADDKLTREYKLSLGLPYSVSKAAVNTVVAKYHAQYADEGVLFLAVCPGTVDTGHLGADYTEKQQQNMMGMFAKFQQYAPHFKAPAQPAEAVADVLKVIYDATVDKNGGDFISHLGTKQWL